MHENYTIRATVMPDIQNAINRCQHTSLSIAYQRIASIIMQYLYIYIYMYIYVYSPYVLFLMGNIRW